MFERKRLFYVVRLRFLVISANNIFFKLVNRLIHHFLILQPQLFSNDSQVIYGVNLSLNVSYIVIIKCT